MLVGVPGIPPIRIRAAAARRMHGTGAPPPRGHAPHCGARPHRTRGTFHADTRAIECQHDGDFSPVPFLRAPRADERLTVLHAVATSGRGGEVDTEPSRAEPSRVLTASTRAGPRPPTTSSAPGRARSGRASRRSRCSRASAGLRVRCGGATAKPRAWACKADDRPHAWHMRASTRGTRRARAHDACAAAMVGQAGAAFERDTRRGRRCT